MISYLRAFKVFTIVCVTSAAVSISARGDGKPDAASIPLDPNAPYFNNWSERRDTSAPKENGLSQQKSPCAQLRERALECWSARPGSNRRPSAWECDGGRETAQIFVLAAEIGVFKGS